MSSKLTDKQRKAMYAKMNKTNYTKSYTIDEPAVRETTLFIENDYKTYQNQTAWAKNFALKMKKGTYDKTKAKQAIADYLVKEGIKNYNSEFGTGSIKLNPKERLKVAEELLPSIEEQAEEYK